MVQTRIIRVAIADDNEMLRHGMRVVLETFSDLELVGEARNGLEAIDICRAMKPDVLLIDLIMPEMNGVAALHVIQRELPHIRCIALTSYDEGELVSHALQAGAISYLIKNMSLDALADAIRNAYLGKATYAQEAVQALQNRAAEPPSPPPPLSQGEHEVLQLVVRGLNNDDIGAQLSLESAVVEKHVRRLFTKLNANNRTELVITAMHYRLIDMDA